MDREPTIAKDKPCNWKWRCRSNRKTKRLTNLNVKRCLQCHVFPAGFNILFEEDSSMFNASDIRCQTPSAAAPPLSAVKTRNYLRLPSQVLNYLFNDMRVE
ncbi:hypothetical protein D5086_019458 [Populus alba]|uniref:Uncharacterized protein n=1 Tax=Populus alba TaxID=43335 RepID=A0ACC4BHM3_POPAL